jgi:rhamnosyltransferase
VNPRFLVLLAAYNGLQWLDEQVDSILNQQDVDVTILVSVDASSDGTEEWVNRIAQQESRVRVLPHGKRFGGAAKNFFRLLSEASTEGFDYFAFADQDDIWLPQKLARSHQVLAGGAVQAYSADVLAFWPDGREHLIRKSQPQVRYDFLFEAAGPGCTYIFSVELVKALKASLIDNAARIGEVSLHDWYCYAFARANGFKWFIDDHVHMRYRQHENNQVGVNTGLKAFRKRLAQVREGWWLSQAKLIADLVGMRESAFVRSWSSLGRIALFRLALRCTACRRRLRDKIVFALFCLSLAVRGVKK